MIQKRIIVLSLIILLSITSINTSFEVSSLSTMLDISTEFSQSLHTITRKQALLDYLDALYIPEEGAFYGYLKDWPTDIRIESCHSIFDVYYPFQIFSYLDHEDVFDWSNSTSFLLGLTNDEIVHDIYGPINASVVTPCSVITSRVAVELFSELYIDDELDITAIKGFVRDCQGSSGGFTLGIWDETEEDLISTQCGLYTMRYLESINQIDVESSLNFILSCYSDGGFSYTPDSDVDISATPLGLLSLIYLDKLEQIDIDDTVSFVFSNFNNESGFFPDGTLVDTERIVWSLYLLDALDALNKAAVIEWVLSCQSVSHGAFLPYPGADSIDERLEWTRAALHILYFLDEMDVLDDEFTVLEYPQHTIPEGYYDFIEENIGTSTIPNVPWNPLPRIDILSVISNFAPTLTIIGIILLPIGYIYYSDRKKREQRILEKKRRKKRL